MFEETSKKIRSPRKHSPYVVIQDNGKDYFINKTTVFGFYKKERKFLLIAFFGCEVNNHTWMTAWKVFITLSAMSHPTVMRLQLEICVYSKFKEYISNWQIGKVLKFCYYKQKTKTSQQYRSSVAKVMSTEHIGVLCSWYSEVKKRIFTCLPSSETGEVIHT